ncbi:MAG TPA: GNAT family N-acetyltransferase [Bacteroidota bacterium]|nr:GNAT family N-acetyltransferase [Bacteroidota bacterium]
MVPAEESFVDIAGEDDLPRLFEVWESSVRATHAFLAEKDIQFLIPLVRDTLARFSPLHCVRDADHRPVAFLGVANEKIEMLFVHADWRGRGIGTKLTQFAIDDLGARCVDVNEQNDPAIGFYENLGFSTVARSPLDGEGMPFPILHMELIGTAVEVRRSLIEGLGIFALRDFHAGDRLRRVRVMREITEDAPLRTDAGERADHCDYVDGRVLLLDYPDRHINHSCDPNVYQLFEGKRSYFVARRKIAAGDEVTCDYNVNITAGTAWPCACGAGRCRKRVEGDFFLLPLEWQIEYRPLLADWFVQRNRERIEALDKSIRT